MSAAHETGTFSLEAGTTGSVSLCAKTTAPVRASTAIAEVRSSERWGERRDFASRDVRSPEAAGVDETTVEAIAVAEEREKHVPGTHDPQR